MSHDFSTNIHGLQGLLLEVRKVRGQEGRLLSVSEAHEIIFPRPVRERENFLANTSEHRNSGEGYDIDEESADLGGQKAGG